MSRPRHGVAFHPDDDLWDSIAAASRRAMAGVRRRPGEIVAVGLCTIRCCKAFLRADGSLARAGHQLDGRPRLPALPARRPRARVRDDLLRLPRPPLHRRAPRQRRQQHPPAVADRHRHAGSGATTRRCSSSSASPGRCSSSCSCPATSRARDAPRPPRRPASRSGCRSSTTANDKAVEALGAGPLGEQDGARLARHLHRRDGARAARTARRRRTSGRTSPASPTATCTRATACAAGCGR